ncbi:TniQ family protein [Paracidovorax cattleyae]|nr:TniQ family protein [Paracidovorax cattleyae]
MLDSKPLRLWPNHFKPLPDELLGSWMLRLAHAHGYKAEQLSLMFVGRDKPLWNRDVDRWAGEELRRSLREATAASDPQISAATLHAYEGYVSGKVTLNGNSRWLTHLGVFHRVRRRAGLACCSLCLSSDREPYYRRAWRLSFITVCSVHQCELIDACPRCSAAFMPHRIDVGRDGYAPRRGLLALCSACGYDMRKHVPQKAKAALVAWTSTLLDAAQLGHLAWAGIRDLHSVLFFDGLRPLTECIVSQVLRLSGDVDELRIAVRRSAMDELSTMLSNPLRYTRERGLNFTQVVGTRGGMQRPLWLETMFCDLRMQRTRHHTHEELAGIARALDVKVGKVSLALAKEHFGANIPKGTSSSFYRSQVSNEAYESLLISLDHAVGSTADPKTRLALLQDKLAISMVRVLGMSMVELAAMTLDQAADRLPRPDVLKHPGHQPVPTAEDQISDHLWWHVEKVRPRIPGASHCSRLFLSCHTGRPMGDTSFGNRFASAVRAAYLTAAISSVDALRRRPAIALQEICDERA